MNFFKIVVFLGLACVCLSATLADCTSSKPYLKVDTNCAAACITASFVDKTTSAKASASKFTCVSKCKNDVTATNTQDKRNSKASGPYDCIEKSTCDKTIVLGTATNSNVQTCQDTCPTGTADKTANKKAPWECKASCSKYKEGSDCVDTCTGTKLRVDSLSPKECVATCPSSHPWKNSVECLKTCDTANIKDSAKKICKDVECGLNQAGTDLTSKKYYDDGKSKNIATNCLTACDAAKFYDKSKATTASPAIACLAACPSGTKEKAGQTSGKPKECEKTSTFAKSLTVGIFSVVGIFLAILN